MNESSSSSSSSQHVSDGFEVEAQETDPSFVPSLAKVLTHLISMSQPNTGQVGEIDEDTNGAEGGREKEGEVVGRWPLYCVVSVCVQVTRFHAIKAPSISIHEYLTR